MIGSSLYPLLSATCRLNIPSHGHPPPPTLATGVLHYLPDVLSAHCWCTLTSYLHSPLPKTPPSTYHAAITSAHCIPTIPHPIPFNTSLTLRLLASPNLRQHHSILPPIIMRPHSVPKKKTPHYIPRAINQCTPQKVTLSHPTMQRPRYRFSRASIQPGKTCL
jgi:hypothetical protein